METRFDLYARNYASLSVQDLLDARDAYHIHLCHLANVFATAVGFYRIKEKDHDHRTYLSPALAVQQKKLPVARTFENSVVRPWSWPCVLVLVREWLSDEELKHQRGQVVPPFLYLRDGRVIPTCVVKAATFDGARDRVGPLLFSSHVIGGGYPVLTDVQGAEHVGSVGCLVTDGERYYALTNQHVAGEAGRPIHTTLSGRRSRIGVAGHLSLRKAPFTKIYPSLAGTDTECNLDAGLIDLDDISQWTARVFGLGQLGPTIDFDATTANLNWIGVDVVAHGGASGRLEGEIKALFYRYRSIAGTDYVSDFLIGGRARKPLETLPGDSGTVWCIDPRLLKRPGDRGKNGIAPAEDQFRPFAVQWGGQRLSGAAGGTVTRFALASSLAVICRELDVELVTDLRAQLTQYWGAVGHYKIAQLAAQRVKEPLKSFIQQNLPQLSYDDATLATGKVAHDAKKFVPLADVPDIVWKTNMNRGGKAARAQENWNHYADMDLPGANGKTLFDLVGTHQPKLDIAAWINFYRTAPQKPNMGSLPFRVWQVFEAMADYRAKGKAAEFLCAAGILAHYVGDACQPLHGSQHADGLNGTSTGVHSAYEEKMIDAYAGELKTKLDHFTWSSLKPALTKVKTGHDAGVACVKLMRRSQQRLAPTTICQLFDAQGGGASKPVIKALWDQLQDATCERIADGARTLAMLWESAYAAGHAAAFAGAVPQPTLKGIYEKKTFLPSLHLANLDPQDYPLPGG